MDEFDNNNDREELGGAEDAYGAPVTDNGDPGEPAARPEPTDDFSGASAGTGYSFHSDGAYGYSRPEPQQDAAPQFNDAPQNTGVSQGTGAPQNTGATQGTGAPQSGYGYRSQTPPYTGQYSGQPGGYSYSNNPYPYQRQQGYAYQQPEGGKKKSNGGKVFGIVTGSLCLILIVALVCVIAFEKKPDKVTRTGDDAAISEEQATKNENVGELETAESPEAVGKTGSKDELSAKQVYQKVLGASVGILVYSKSDSLASEGTGVLFKEDDDGEYTYIITCAHVIAGTSGTIMVQLHDEKQYQAEIVGYDNRTDIGVLRIKESGLQLAEIGDSSKLAVGDTVYAIGNPGGVEFANSFTGGMVSALDRPVNSSSSGYTMECIQHTAAINPGNSGGALVNVFGQVIGINSMKIVDDEYEGMGFSVPSSVFVDIVNNIIVNGYVANRPKLGITYVAAQNYNSYGMFVAIKGLPKGSIVIYSIAKDSSLVGTEAQQGDMIVAVNGKNLDDANYLPELIENSKVGDEITLKLIRINKDYSYEEFEVKVTLVEDRGDTVIEEETTADRGDYEDYFKDYFDDYFNDYFGDFFH